MCELLDPEHFWNPSGKGVYTLLLQLVSMTKHTNYSVKTPLFIKGCPLAAENLSFCTIDVHLSKLIFIFQFMTAQKNQLR